LKLAPAAGSGDGAARLNTVRGRDKYAEQPGIPIAPAWLRHGCLHAVSDDGIRKKEGIALELTYPLSVLCHIFYIEFNDLVLDDRNRQLMVF
jgi:hypothetical protein